MGVSGLGNAAFTSPHTQVTSTLRGRPTQLPNMGLTPDPEPTNEGQCLLFEWLQDQCQGDFKLPRPRFDEHPLSNPHTMQMDNTLGFHAEAGFDFNANTPPHAMPWFVRIRQAPYPKQLPFFLLIWQMISVLKTVSPSVLQELRERDPSCWGEVVSPAACEATEATPGFLGTVTPRERLGRAIFHAGSFQEWFTTAGFWNHENLRHASRPEEPDGDDGILRVSHLGGVRARTAELACSLMPCPPVACREREYLHTLVGHCCGVGGGGARAGGRDGAWSGKCQRRPR